MAKHPRDRIGQHIEIPIPLLCLRYQLLSHMRQKIALIRPALHEEFDLLAEHLRNGVGFGQHRIQAYNPKCERLRFWFQILNFTHISQTIVGLIFSLQPLAFGLSHVPDVLGFA